MLPAALAVGLYLALTVTEMARSGTPFDPLELAVDLFEVALLAGAVALTALASVEARAMRFERKALIRDLADARR
ncbi:MAG: hypothetical protein OEM24_04180, partial [Paracoccaceae bacterium]|nr:hypothetical protein [Paracoccaceae bacterium]